ncbi:hypothetical protein ATANTOWER_023916 [Ataeniobius toweri]|uniref:Secreted protein n=1 Tax=Ataeniobius toweri TaxID=208326 RepID=A0ABU7CD30_9TELE|nr:hypothetical protein [Ataeniobius toweri]
MLSPAAPLHRCSSSWAISLLLQAAQKSWKPVTQCLSVNSHWCQFQCSFVSLSVEDLCEIPRLSSSLDQFSTTGFHSAVRLAHSWLRDLHDLFAQHHFALKALWIQTV